MKLSKRLQDFVNAEVLRVDAEVKAECPGARLRAPISRPKFGGMMMNVLLGWDVAIGDRRETIELSDELMADLRAAIGGEWTGNAQLPVN